ncbi:hypothetical protein BE221DRAFT_171714 [Ostreococcus tauri]|uniref:Uncharacterized protein n=1 Tax=Ostreococcus tauri TaxID=70448 RepID=A0A1Y5ICF7_OSTTA|nr:hypothetical protein BE221DRAFT_171714 [Ostreococcus tauri]
MSRPRVRRDDRLAHRSPVCVCNVCKRRVHVELSHNNTCTLHCGALQVYYLSIVTPDYSSTSGMQVVYPTKFCKTVEMNYQAVLACPIRFKLFYRRSVKVRSSPLTHSSPCYSPVQCCVIRVYDGIDNFRSVSCVSVPPLSQTMRVIFRVLHVTLVPHLDHSGILLFKISHIHRL